MYSKVFSQIFDSSIAEDYVVRHVFMDLLVLADKWGEIDMTLEAIARRTNVPIELVTRAITTLMQADTSSRSKEEYGKRLVLLDKHRDWGWKIVNYKKYRAMQDSDARRSYWRDYKRQRRAAEKLSDDEPIGKSNYRPKKVVPDIPILSQDSTDADAEADAYLKTLNPPPPLECPHVDAKGDPRGKPVVVMPVDPLGNPEVYTQSNLIALACPEARLRGWSESKITHAHRVAIITAARGEAVELGVSMAEAMNGLLIAVQDQTSSVPEERWQYMGNLETYFRKQSYRIPPKNLMGGNDVRTRVQRNHPTKADRTIQALAEFRNRIATDWEPVGGDGGMQADAAGWNDAGGIRKAT
jgi:hypothetical protein